MIITLNVTVAKAHWGDESTVRKEVEVKTENPVPAELPWAAICAGFVQSALKEYEQNEEKEIEHG